MPAGAEFYTDTGVVQIDETAPVLCLRYMGTATVVNRHPASLFTTAYIAKTVDITVTAQSPIIALAGPGGYGVIAAIKSGDNWTFRIIGYEHNPTFQYFIFDKPVTTPSGAGFEVSDANGNVVFSSLYRPFVPVSFAPSPNGGEYFPLPTGRSYATICNARISLYENSEVFTDTSVWTYWTYELTTAYAGPSTIGGTNNGIGVITNAIAGGVNQGPTSPVKPSGDLGGWGAGTSLIGVDVTDLIGGPVNPGGPVVTVNATIRTANGPGSGTTVTDAVTASASGGSAPYAFQWDKITGESGVVAYGATNTAALRTQVVNQVAGSTMSSTWRCRVTDNAGRVNFSPVVTMKHVQAEVQGDDYTPDNFTLPTMTVSSNDPDVSWSTTSYGTYTVTGINKPITVRFERYDYSGNLNALHIDVFTWPPGATGWTHHGYYDAHGTGMRYMDIPNVVNGTRVAYNAHAITNSGRRSGACRFVLWALQSNVQFASSASCSYTVDADDNFNKGTGGNAPFAMPALSAWGSNGYAYETVVGPVLTATETLTVETSVPNGIATGRIVSFAIASEGGTALSFAWGGNAAKSGTVNALAGKRLNASIDLTTVASSGVRSIAFTVTIKNAAGTTLSTFNVSANAPASGGIEV